MKTKTLKQTISIKVSPHEVYEALMDSKKHSKFTGDKASISRAIGGKFSVFSGYADGVNLELIPDKKIAQSWRASDWKDRKHFSRVSFVFTETKTGTKINFTHAGVPDEAYKDIKQGWIDYYWKPMKEMLEKNPGP